MKQFNLNKIHSGSFVTAYKTLVKGKFVTQNGGMKFSCNTILKWEDCVQTQNLVKNKFVTLNASEIFLCKITYKSVLLTLICQLCDYVHIVRGKYCMALKTYETL